MSSLLKVLKGIEDQAMEGKSPDPSYSRKILADYACICLERAFLADDEEIPLLRRADMALRIGPVVAMLETLIPKDAGKGMPRTEEALDKEIGGHFNRMKALVGYTPNASAQQVLDTLAPAAAAPPEEA